MPLLGACLVQNSEMLPTVPRAARFTCGGPSSRRGSAWQPAKLAAVRGRPGRCSQTSPATKCATSAPKANALTRARGDVQGVRDSPQWTNASPRTPECAPAPLGWGLRPAPPNELQDQPDIAAPSEDHFQLRAASDVPQAPRASRSRRVNPPPPPLVFYLLDLSSVSNA